MSLWSHIVSTLRNFFRRQQVESQLDDEVRSYVDLITDENLAAGMSPSEARRSALANSGGVEQVKQAVRDNRAGASIELLAQDARYGLRQLWRNPRLHRHRHPHPRAFHRRKYRDLFHRQRAHAPESALPASRAHGHYLHTHPRTHCL